MLIYALMIIFGCFLFAGISFLNSLRLEQPIRQLLIQRIQKLPIGKHRERVRFGKLDYAKFSGIGFVLAFLFGIKKPPGNFLRRMQFPTLFPCTVLRSSRSKPSPNIANPPLSNRSDFPRFNDWG